MIVAKYTPQLLGLWMPKGARLMSGLNNGILHLTGKQFENLDWTMHQREWQGEGSLRLKIPDSLWSLNVFSEDRDGRSEGLAHQHGRASFTQSVRI
jgi:hypothetical protein